MTAARDPQHIVVYRTAFLGDTLCAIPAFRLVRRAYPRARITLLTDASAFQQNCVEQILAPLEIFDEFASYRATRGWRSAWNLFRKLRALRPDLLVALPQVKQPVASRRRYRQVFRAAGVKRVVGMTLSEPVGEVRLKEADRLIALLNFAGIPGPKPAYDIPVNVSAAASLREKLAPQIDLDRPYVVFCGGGKTSTQRWMPDRYAEVLAEIERQCGVQLVGVGSPAELETYARDIVPHCPGLRLASSLDLAELMELLRGAVSYFGNDTGPMHMAATIGCPVAVVMSARNPRGQWDPDVEPQLLIRHSVPCEACYLSDCIVERHRCMTEITAAEVQAQVVPFIQSVLHAGRCAS